MTSPGNPAPSAEFTSSSHQDSRPTRHVFPQMDLLTPGEPVAVDIEFQNYRRSGEPKAGQRLGWIAAVNAVGETVLECHVNYPAETGVEIFVPGAHRGFGVGYDDLKMKNGAIPAAYAERWFEQIFAGRTVIVHGGSADRKAFYNKDAFAAAKEVVDTQHLYGQVKLSTLHAREFPDAVAIQVGRHTPIEDAQATMQLYLKQRPYDRAAEIETLRGQGLSTTCEPSEEQLRQVEEVKQKHRQAAQQAEQHARSQSAKGNRGRRGGNRGRGVGRA